MALENYVQKKSVPTKKYLTQLLMGFIFIKIFVFLILYKFVELEFLLDLLFLISIGFIIHYFTLIISISNSTIVKVKKKSCKK